MDVRRQIINKSFSYGLLAVAMVCLAGCTSSVDETPIPSIFEKSSGPKDVIPAELEIDSASFRATRYLGDTETTSVWVAQDENYDVCIIQARNVGDSDIAGVGCGSRLAFASQGLEHTLLIPSGPSSTVLVVPDDFDQVAGRSWTKITSNLWSSSE